MKMTVNGKERNVLSIDHLQGFIVGFALALFLMTATIVMAKLWQ